MIELHQLRYFSRAAETLNFSRAAAELFISRQALTKSIQVLEKELGWKLFKIETGKVTLTPMGEVMKAQCQSVLKSYDMMLLQLEQYAPHKTRLLRVGAAVGTILSLPENCVQDFCDAQPDVQLAIEQTSTDNILKMVCSGEADVGLVGSIPAYLEGFSMHCLVKKGTYIGICPGHPLYGYDSLEIRDLKDHPFVTAGTNNHMHRFLVQSCHNTGFSPTIAFMSSSEDVLLQYALDHKMLFFAFGDWTCRTPDGPVKVVPLDVEQGKDFGTFLIWKNELKPIAAQFLAYLTENADHTM